MQYVHYYCHIVYILIKEYIVQYQSSLRQRAEFNTILKNTPFLSSITADRRKKRKNFETCIRNINKIRNWNL